LGLLGIIVEATMRTVPLFKIVIHRAIEPESILNSFEGDGSIISRARVTDFLQMAWFPSVGKVVVIHGNFTNNVSLPGDFYSTFIKDVSSETVTTFSGIYDLLQERRNIPGFWALEENAILALTTNKDMGEQSPIYTSNGTDSANPAVGYGWKMMSAHCTQCLDTNGNHSLYYEEVAIGCDVKELPAIVQTIRGIIQDYSAAFPVSGVLFRFVPQSDAYLSFANGRDVVVVELITPMRNDMFSRPKAGLAAYQAIAQALVNNF